jgi:hypothetical protein
MQKSGLGRKNSFAIPLGECVLLSDAKFVVLLRRKNAVPGRSI